MPDRAGEIKISAVFAKSCK